MKPTIGARGKAIAQAICDQLNIEFAEVAGRRQTRHAAVPRQAIMAALVDAGYGNHTIGHLLNRDASTVCTGAHTHRLRMLWVDVLTSAAACDCHEEMRRAA